MMKKFGVNETRAEKRGPVVKDAVASKSRHVKVVTCECGTRLEKSCPDELACELSSLKCPKCGKEV